MSWRSPPPRSRAEIHRWDDSPSCRWRRTCVRWPGSPRSTGIAPYRHGVPEFHHTDVLPLGPDATEYRRLDLPAGDLVDVPALGRQFLQVPPATLTALVRTAVRDISHLLRPVAPRPAARDHRRPRGVGERPLRRHGPAAQRLRLRGRGAADVPGHRHGDRRRQAHRDRADRRERRGGDLPRGLRGLRVPQPALLADGAHVVLGRAQHRHEPARAGRAVQRAGRRPTLRAAGDGQGRRVGQQDLPVPGDQGAAEPEAAGDLPRREAALAGHGGVPALPPGDRRRRDVGGVHPQGREAGVGALPGHAAGVRLRAGARLPRPGPGAAGAGADPRVRHRRAVRRASTSATTSG